MSDSMDKDIFNMDEIEKLMETMFDADQSTDKVKEALSNELTKMGGSLEMFMDDEVLREEKIREWLSDPQCKSGTRPYQSLFGGTEKHSLNGQQDNNNEIVFEKDEQNSSLAGVKNITGIEDIQDFFVVGRGQKEVDYDLTEIDEQTEAMKNLSTSEQCELDSGFVRDMGMDLQRIRKIAGATSAWHEIRQITSMLEDITKQTNIVKYRFEQFIDLYVKDKIPK